MNRIFLIGSVAFAALFSIALLPGLTATWGLWDPTLKRQIPTEEEIPSSFLIGKANELAEAKAFRDRYGEPNAWVDRTYGLDVYLSKKQCQLTGEECSDDKYERLNEPISALQIRMDNNGDPKSIVLWCGGGDDDRLEDRIDHNIIERLKTDTETCF